MSTGLDYDPVADLMAAMSLKAKVLAHLCAPDTTAFGDALAASRFLASAADHLRAG